MVELVLSSASFYLIWRLATILKASPDKGFSFFRFGLTYRDLQGCVRILISVAGPDQKPVNVLRLPIEGVVEFERSGGLLELELWVAAADQLVSDLPDGVRVDRPHGGDGMSDREILRHGVFQLRVPERRRTVVLVENVHSHLERETEWN